MHLGILQCGHVPEEVAATDGPYETLIGNLFAHRGFTQTLWSVVDGDFPPGPDAADGWLVTGSKHGAYENHAWIPPLEQLIRDIQAAEKPLVGICFGHQIIADALGGEVVKSDRGWGLGLHRYKMAEPTAWMGDATAEQPLRLHAVHQDQVVSVPPGARVLAASEFCPNAILAYGDTVFTVQPHPEFEASFVGELIRERLSGTVPPAVIAAAKGGLGGETDNSRLARWIVGFLRHAAAARAGDPEPAAAEQPTDAPNRARHSTAPAKLL